MSNYYLAVDIGASSGRHILCHMEDGKMVLEEVHRFWNGMKEKNGAMCWDVDTLFSEIKTGMKKCKEMGKIPVSMGIDTWGVDFVLLDKEGKRLGNAVGYRDGRTKGMDEKVYEIIPEDALYARSGIQKQLFNTVYQLMALKEKQPDLLNQAETLLMIPDYFHYLLTGEKCVEYTNATTGQLVSPQTKDWDYELIEMLGYPKKIFPEIKTPGTLLGTLTSEVTAEVGYSCNVVLPATHDTGSAVLAVPSNQQTIYISSGTWSLMGIERMEADTTSESKQLNFTNEGGYNYRFRYLKNIMGLWMIQNVKKELDDKYSFAELCDMASKETIPSIVSCNDDCFLAPESMMEEVKSYCKKTNQEIPETPAQISSVIYNSLAKCYGDTISEIEHMTGKHFDHINVVGGGANAVYLNQLTAKYTGRTVYAGPTEATAIGNLMVQMMHTGELESLESARNCVFASFDVKTYK